MTHFAEVMFGHYRFHAHSSSPEKAIELVKCGVYSHAEQNNLNLSNWSQDLIEVNQYEPEKCYRDHSVIVDNPESEQISLLSRRIHDLWDGACNHPCDPNNIQAADRDELMRFARSVERNFRSAGRIDIMAILSIDFLIRMLYAKGARA